MLIKTYTQLAQELYNAFLQGQVEIMIEALDEKVEWLAPVTGNIPFSGTYTGPTGFMQWLETFSKSLNVQVFEPREFYEEGNRVIVFVYVESSVIKNDRKVISPEVHYWTFEGDKVVKFQSYSNIEGTEAAFAAD